MKNEETSKQQLVADRLLEHPSVMAVAVDGVAFAPSFGDSYRAQEYALGGALMSTRLDKGKFTANCGDLRIVGVNTAAVGVVAVMAYGSPVTKSINRMILRAIRRYYGDENKAPRGAFVSEFVASNTIPDDTTEDK